MKLYIKLFSIVFIIIGMFLGSRCVKALELSVDFADFYYVRTDKDGNKRSWNHPIYKINGEETYCIQFEIRQGSDYQIASWKDANISDSLKEKVLLTAYYGYEYPGHKTLGYLAATQAILWELTASDGAKVTFNTERFGTGTNVDFQNERKEIEYLVNHHYDKPNLNANYQVNLGENLVINDNILANYDLVSSDGLNVVKSDKTMTINGSKSGNYQIRLLRKQVYSHPYYILTSTGYQNMLMGGNLEPYYISFNVNVLSGNLLINKQDKDTDNNILMSGIKFKLKNINGNEICRDKCIYETDDNGQIHINNLPYGKYYLEEIDDIYEGYIWNDEILEVEINKNNNEITFYNKPVYGQIDITKYGEDEIINDETVDYFEVPLEGVKYILKAKEPIYSNRQLIYDKDDIVFESKTNADGKILIDNLPLGNYYLYEESTVANHILDKNIYDIALNYVDQYTQYVMISKEFKNYLPRKVIIKEEIPVYEKFTSTAENIMLDVPDTSSNTFDIINIIFILINLLLLYF